MKAGYRLIDTANDYGNEHMIGEALQELFSRGVVTRDQLFIQSKLWNANHRCRNRFLFFWRENEVFYFADFLTFSPSSGTPTTGAGTGFIFGGKF